MHRMGRDDAAGGGRGGVMAQDGWGLTRSGSGHHLHTLRTCSLSAAFDPARAGGDDLR